MGLAEIVVLFCLNTGPGAICTPENELAQRHIPIESCRSDYEPAALTAIHVFIDDMGVKWDQNDLLIGFICADGLI